MTTIETRRYEMLVRVRDFGEQLDLFPASSVARDQFGTKDLIAALTKPPRLWSREEILTPPSPVPKVNGLYAWFFRKVPKGVPATDCIRHNGLRLLWVGTLPALGVTRPRPLTGTSRRPSIGWLQCAPGVQRPRVTSTLPERRSLCRGTSRQASRSDCGESWMLSGIGGVSGHPSR